jgi:hypothetical protein
MPMSGEERKGSEDDWGQEREGKARKMFGVRKEKERLGRCLGSGDSECGEYLL